jgi:hypothetical protein
VTDRIISNRYSPVSTSQLEEPGTLYQIDIRVDAFPTRTPTSGEVDVVPVDKTWTVGFRSGGKGYIGAKLEGWVAGKLLGNVSKGER